MFLSAVLPSAQAVAAKLPKAKYLKSVTKGVKTPSVKPIVPSRLNVPTTSVVLPAAYLREAYVPISKGVKPSAGAQTNLHKTIHARVNKKFLKNKIITFDKQERIESILNEEHDVLGALKKVWLLQDQYGAHDFFEIFATTYYYQHFKIMTPHLYQLFQKVARSRSRDLEYALIKRMRFLSMNRDHFRAKFAPNIPKAGMRMRYLRDIKYLDQHNFVPSDLVFSFERKMDPGQANNTIIRHVRIGSQFPAGDNLYPVFHYQGSAELLPNLYRYLLNGKKLRSPLTMIFDEKLGALAIYNHDYSVWLRVTAHEYSDLNRLHIHLNETLSASITTISEIETEETVHFNLSIPLLLPSDFPSHLTPEEQQKWLYQKFVEHPVKHFKGDNRVTILYRSIF